MIPPDVDAIAEAGKSRASDVYPTGARCWKCQFWSPIGARSADMSFDAPGLCRRHAPRPVRNPEELTLHDVSWPCTYAGEFCGDFALLNRFVL